jgi:hypothetical protein
MQEPTMTNQLRFQTVPQGEFLPEGIFDNPAFRIDHHGGAFVRCVGWPGGLALGALVRLGAFNAFNHPNFLGVSQNLTAANFGVVTSARDGRIVQLGAKLLF